MNILRPKISEQELAQMIMSRGYDYRELPDEKYPEYTIVWAIRGGNSIWLGEKTLLLACSKKRLEQYRMNKLV